MKWCNQCGLEKDESEFYNSKYTPDGKYWSCISCNRKRGKNLRLKRKEASGIGWTSTCSTIRKHHENMKDDPERLSTEFLQNILGRKCK